VRAADCESITQNDSVRVYRYDTFFSFGRALEQRFVMFRRGERPRARDLVLFSPLWRKRVWSSASEPPHPRTPNRVVRIYSRVAVTDVPRSERNVKADRVRLEEEDRDGHPKTSNGIRFSIKRDSNDGRRTYFLFFVPRPDVSRNELCNE